MLTVSDRVVVAVPTTLRLPLIVVVTPSEPMLTAPPDVFKFNCAPAALPSVVNLA